MATVGKNGIPAADRATFERRHPVTGGGRLNPVVVYPRGQGAVALDALILAAAHGAS